METKTRVAEEIFDAICELKDASGDKTEGIREYLVKSARVINSAIIDVLDKDLKEDPDVFIEEIRGFHYIISGLLGLAYAVHRKEKYHILVNLLKNKGKRGEGPASTEREHIFKGETADVEGICVMLEGIQANLSSRASIPKITRRRFEG